MEAEKRKLIKFSNYSLCVTLPKWVVRDLKWKKGDLVNMDVDAGNGKIIISKGRQTNREITSQNKDSVEKSSDSLRW